MLYWLLEKGFTKEQIEKYAKSKNSTLKELMQNTNIQIDNIISRQLLLELYENKLIQKEYFIKN